MRWKLGSIRAGEAIRSLPRSESMPDTLLACAADARRARLRRLDHERRRRAAMGRRAAVVGAVDGARARASVHALRDRRRQRRHRARRADPGVRARAPRRPTGRSTSAASTSAPTTCARFDWDPFAYERGLGEALAFVAARCERTLTATLPLDLGRPRAGAKVADANAIIERRAREAGALVVDLAGFRGRSVLMADHVHPTAFGQIAIAERALAVLEADGLPARTPPARADPLRDDPLGAAARRRDLRVPAREGQRGGGAANLGCGWAARRG